jgi:hypothetical protein
MQLPPIVTPAPPPPPFDQPPRVVPQAYLDSLPRTPANPIELCGWPLSDFNSGLVVNDFGGASQVSINAVNQRTGLHDIGGRTPVLNDAAPIGCLPGNLVGPREPLPDELAAQGLPVFVWDHLTPVEKDFAKRHPVIAMEFYHMSILAKDETQRRWANEAFRDVNGPENAFQHAFWNALMAWGRGESLAKEEADAHEDFPNNPPRERDMDLHNNAIGRPIGSGTSQWSGWPQIADAVFHACIEQHKCVWLTGPGATP